MANSSGELTPLQERFILEYIICLNATEACRRAGYKGNSKTLAVQGYDNLRLPKIRARIDEILEQQNLSRHEIIGRLSAQARGDMGDFIDPATLSVDWKHARELGITHLIKKAKVTTITSDDKETQIFEFELHDPQAALVHLGRAQSLFTDKKDITSNGESIAPTVLFVWDDGDDNSGHSTD